MGQKHFFYLEYIAQINPVCKYCVNTYINEKEAKYLTLQYSVMYLLYRDIL